MGTEGLVYEGKTLDDAVRKGLEALGLSRAEVMITMVEEGSSGFLGLGSRPYRVRVMPRPGGPIAEPDDRERRGGRRPHGRNDRGDRSGRRGERSQSGSGRGPQSRGPERDRGGRVAESGGRRGPQESRRPEGRRPEGGRPAGRRPEGAPRDESSRGDEARRNDASRMEQAPPPRPEAPRDPIEQGDEGRRRRRGRRGGRRGRGEGAPGVVAGSEAHEFERAPETYQDRDRLVPESTPEPSHEPAGFRASRPSVSTHAVDDTPAMPPEELAASGQRLGADLLKAMGFEATVTATAAEDRVEISVSLPEHGDLLAGPKGEVRLALQHLLNLMINQGGSTRYHVQLEINDFWQRRENELTDLARALAEEALASGEEVVTEYLNAQERRVVHTTLKEDGRVKTYALGTGLIKRVAVAPADYPEAERSEG